MSPMSNQRADALARFAGSDLDGMVLDLGCGWAELLLRVVAGAPGSRGVGVDVDEVALSHGRALAEQRGLGDRVSLLANDAGEFSPGNTDAVLCVGASHIFGAPAEQGQPLDYARALRAIRELVPRGARVVYGESIWSRPPTPEAVAQLSGRTDELVSLSELVELAVGHDFMPVAVGEASLEEWDEFESGYSACYASWLAMHDPDDPDAGEVRAAAARQRAAYLRGYRGVLGMAYLALVAT